MATNTDAWQCMPKFNQPINGGRYCAPVLKMGKLGPAVSVSDRQFAIIQFGCTIIRILLYDDDHRVWSHMYSLAEPCYHYINWQDEVSLAFAQSLYLFFYRKQVMYIMSVTHDICGRYVTGNAVDEFMDYRYSRITSFNEQLCMVACTLTDNLLIYRAWNGKKYDFDDAIILSRTLALKDYSLHTDQNSIWVIGAQVVYSSTSIVAASYVNPSTIHQFIITDDRRFIHRAYTSALLNPMVDIVIGSYYRFHQFVVCGRRVSSSDAAISLEITKVTPQFGDSPLCNNMPCNVFVTHRVSVVVLCNPVADIKAVSGYIRRTCHNRNFPPAYLLKYICNYYINAYLHIIDRLSGDHYRSQLD